MLRWKQKYEFTVATLQVLKHKNQVDQLKAAEIEAQMAMKQQELALRRQLSELTNDMRKGQPKPAAAKLLPQL